MGKDRKSSLSPFLAHGWTNLEGLWWLFHREVDSTHNRSAPDIQITVDTPAVFRVERAGHVFADRSFHGAGFVSGGADIAELINVSESVGPGDVVELDPNHPGMYRKTSGSHSRLVAGVISSAPGIVLGSQELADDRPLLALMGVVPVKATAENGPIRPGDLLVSSSLPSYVMRCADPGKCEGAIIGKALEPLEEETGVIKMLVMR